MARRTSYGMSEGTLIPMAIRPVQFQDLWSRPATASPERSLALAVVQEALGDLARYRFARRRRQQRLYGQAYAWVASDDRSWPYSFVNLCEGAGLSVDAIRRRALDPMTPFEPTRAAERRRMAPLGKAA